MDDNISKLACIENKNRHGSEAHTYYRVRLDNNGKIEWFIFTANQLSVALRRAMRNPEDLPVEEEESSFSGRIFSFLK